MLAYLFLRYEIRPSIGEVPTAAFEDPGISAAENLATPSSVEVRCGVVLGHGELMSETVGSSPQGEEPRKYFGAVGANIARRQKESIRLPRYETRCRLDVLSKRRMKRRGA